MTHQTDESTASKRVEQIREALDNHNLILEYQAMRPVASPTWGDHIEILCRVPTTADNEAALKPDDFLPIAERFDLAKRLDRQVIRQTLDWLGNQPLLEPRLKYCGFNLSLASVLDDTFADFMADALRESPFAPAVSAWKFVRPTPRNIPMTSPYCVTRCIGQVSALPWTAPVRRWKATAWPPDCRWISSNWTGEWFSSLRRTRCNR